MLVNDLPFFSPAFRFASYRTPSAESGSTVDDDSECSSSEEGTKALALSSSARYSSASGSESDAASSSSSTSGVGTSASSSDSSPTVSSTTSSPSPSAAQSIRPSAEPTLKMDELLLSSSLKREAPEFGDAVEGGRLQDLLVRTSSISSSKAAPFIVLPREKRFEHLRLRQRFAVDIGGTLVKLVYSSVAAADDDDSDENDLLLNFRKFQSIDHCIAFLKTTWRARDSECFLNGTGGGAFKYSELLERELGIRVVRIDEMHSLISGCDFLLRNNEDESFTYHHEATGLERYQYKPIEPKSIYPFLLCNIGTGISILKVDSPTTYTRVGGSTMGGGAFIGLGNLLTSAASFDDLLVLAEKGDHRKVDTLVSDIYGGDYDHLNLRGDVIAGSFGKCTHLNQKRENGDVVTAPKEEDVAKSLLLMISNNIGQMAILYGNRFNLKRIYFGGFFIRKHPISMRTLSYAIDFWSKGECAALFLKHEGYLGAVGSFLDDMDKGH